MEYLKNKTLALLLILLSSVFTACDKDDRTDDLVNRNEDKTEVSSDSQNNNGNNGSDLNTFIIGTWNLAYSTGWYELNDYWDKNHTSNNGNTWIELHMMCITNSIKTWCSELEMIFYTDGKVKVWYDDFSNYTEYGDRTSSIKSKTIYYQVDGNTVTIQDSSPNGIGFTTKEDGTIQTRADVYKTTLMFDPIDRTLCLDYTFKYGSKTFPYKAYFKK